MRRRALICTCLALAGVVTPAAALAPAGPIRQIGAESTEPGLAKALSVGAPAVAWSPGAKRFLVTWRYDGHIDEEPFTRGRFVDADGLPMGEPFRVADGAGGALVHNPATGGYGLIVGGDLVHLDTDGRVLARYRFSSLSPGQRPTEYGEPVLAVDPVSGSYIVAWLYNPQPDERKVLVSLIRPGRGVIDTLHAVLPYGLGAEVSSSPSLAWNPADGTFRLSWSDAGGVKLRRLLPDGRPAGEAVEVAPGAAFGDTAVTTLRDGGSMVVWSASVPDPALQIDGFARRLLPDATPGGGALRVMHVTRPDGFPVMVRSVAVADIGRDGETLAVMDVERRGQEVYGQVLGPDGSPVGDAPMVLSGDPLTVVGDRHGAVAAAPGAGRYLVAWTSARRMEPLEFRVSVRVLAADPVGVPAAAPVCRTLRAPASGTGASGRITLTAGQARITMRIARAALRRAEAAARWLDAGIQGRDLCRHAVGLDEFRPGTTAWPAEGAGAAHEPEPRPVEIAAAAPEPRRVRLDAGRLTLDQETARRAIALVAALERRLDAGLTGGDIADGAVDRAQLAPGFRPVGTPSGPVDPATPVPRAVSVGAAPATVRVTLAQMRTNRRIARAALRRADALIDRLEDGIGPEEIRDGTLTSADLAPGLALSTAP